jgi:biopolymer transport protein ExbD
MARINVTPLIDVLLVLLVTFMVIVPEHSVGLEARMPSPPPVCDIRVAGGLVVRVARDGSAVVDGDRLGAGEWPRRLRALLAPRRDKTVHFAAAGDVEYGVVGRAIDAAVGEGAGPVGFFLELDGEAGGGKDGEHTVEPEAGDAGAGIDRAEVVKAQVAAVI